MVIMKKNIIVYRFFVYLDWRGSFAQECIFAHACNFDRELIDKRVILTAKENHGYAILPWLPLELPKENNDRTHDQKTALGLAEGYTKNSVIGGNEGNLDKLSYHGNLSTRCNLTRQGLEHFFGFRLGL